MSDRLFLSSVKIEDGRMVLGFAVGAPVVLGEARKLRDLGDGRGEYEITVSRDDAQFTVRTVAGASGAVEKVIASVAPIPEDWHQPREE